MSDPHPHDPRAGAQVVESYGAGRFRVSGQIIDGSIIVLPTESHPWTAATLADATADDFAPLIAAAQDIELLLLGCGPRGDVVPEILAELIKLRFHVGLTGRESAAILGVSPRKADQMWAFARAWLRREIGR